MKSQLAMPIAIVVILIAVIVPLPTIVLDVLISANISLSDRVLRLHNRGRNEISARNADCNRSDSDRGHSAAAYDRAGRADFGEYLAFRSGTEVAQPRPQ